MATANDVASVIAGEAVSGTPEERKADMLAIASVIVNRARQLGVSTQDVIAADSQFDAYGKPLPPGVNSDIVAMAQDALDQVERYGPVHQATYYATPSAVKGLPPGLSPETTTTGHQYFSDPLNRPMKTAVGVKQMSGELGSQLMTPSGLLGMDQTPAMAADSSNTSGLLSAMTNQYDPSMTPGQQAIQSILSQPTQTMTEPTNRTGDFSPAQLAAINPTPVNAKFRPYEAEPVVTDNIQAAVTSILGPDARVVTTSGQEGGLPQYGSNRHKTGLAADVNIYTPEGKLLSWKDPADLQIMKDIAQSAATQQANIGLGYNNPNMMHIDYVDPANFSPGQDASWGRIGNDPEFAGLLAEARSSALMPASFYEKANQTVIDQGIVPSSPVGLLSQQQAQQPGVTSSLLATPNEAVTLTDLPAAAPTPEYTARPSLPDYSSMVDQRSAFAPPTDFATDYSSLAKTSRNPIDPQRFTPQIDVATNTQAFNPATLATENQPAAMPSYSDMMARPAPVSLPSAMAMEAPNFNQAMNAATTGIPASVSSMPTIAGPTSLPAIQQQQQQAQPQQLMANTPQVQAMRTAQTQQQPKGLLDGVFTKEAIIGGLLGGVAGGPVGGLLGGLLGRQVANNGGLSAMMQGQPLSINNIGPGSSNVYSVYGGADRGTQAMTNNNGKVTALGDGRTAYTNSYGVTTIQNADGSHAADWSGNTY